MTEPTARKALLSLAERFAVKASTEQRGPYAVHVWWQAEEIARSLAQESPASPADPPAGNREGADGERLRVDLSAARKRLLAAADTALDGLPQPENRFERDRWRIASRFVLDAVEPLIRADERANLRALLLYHVPCCPGFSASVADLLNDHEDSS